MDRKVVQSDEPRGRPVTALDAAKATDCFEHFLNANTLKTILGYYRNICELLHLKPNVFPQFYPKLRGNLQSWRAKALWKKFDLRANNKCYGKGKLCPNTRVLIIGGGPCGLRTAIEAQLLGAKVVVVEKRDRMSRNNVLHLWPFVIDDLRSLGAKKFFGKFCAGAIDHISIRQLQCILLKVALLLGAEVHTEVSFEGLLEPNVEEKTGWRAEFLPSEHPVNQFEFDVIIGADGKRNTLQGFKRKEFRGKLAIAITANFINKRTEAEARVEEISGVAFIFNQKFFKDLYADTGIDLENIVYYKDDTHYFVMTAKKPSLIDKGVIMQDLPDTAKLLAPDNVDRAALMNYAREAAEFSTNYKMMQLEFAVNHYGQPDVAMFDFTSMYAAENASRIIERNGYKLFTILVGDSLLEPFWPTGSGCARGFLSSLDAAWAIRGYGSGMLNPLEVLAERESIYRLLAQTTPENLNKDYKGYTLDPSTRYPNLNRNVLLPQQTLSLYDSDEPRSIELSRNTSNVLDGTKKRRRRESHVDPDTLLSWIKEQIKEHDDLQVNDITTSFKDGRLLCAIIQHYRPDLLDYASIGTNDAATINQIAFDLLENEIGIPPIMTGEEMSNIKTPDFLTMVSYLTQIYDIFRCEIPHIKHPKLVEHIPDPKPTIFLYNPYNVKLYKTDVNVEKGKIIRTLEKSKFSLVNRISNIETDLNVKDLNLTPIKSIEDYGNKANGIRKDINRSKNILSKSTSGLSLNGNNSKSVVIKCSISDFQKKRFFFSDQLVRTTKKGLYRKIFTSKHYKLPNSKLDNKSFETIVKQKHVRKNVIKRKNIKGIYGKQNILTQKNIYLLESNILQTKMDAIFKDMTGKPVLTDKLCHIPHIRSKSLETSNEPNMKMTKPVSIVYSHSLPLSNILHEEIQLNHTQRICNKTNAQNKTNTTKVIGDNISQIVTSYEPGKQAKRKTISCELVDINLINKLDCSTSTNKVQFSINTNILDSIIADKAILVTNKKSFENKSTPGNRSEWSLPKLPTVSENNNDFKKRKSCNSICYCCQINKRNLQDKKIGNIVTKVFKSNENLLVKNDGKNINGNVKCLNNSKASVKQSNKKLRENRCCVTGNHIKNVGGNHIKNVGNKKNSPETNKFSLYFGNCGDTGNNKNLTKTTYTCESFPGDNKFHKNTDNLGVSKVIPEFKNGFKSRKVKPNVNDINKVFKKNKYSNDANLVNKTMQYPISKCINTLLSKLKGTFGYNPVNVVKTNVNETSCRNCHVNFRNKFSLVKMSHSESNLSQPERTFDRVVNWITVSNFDIRNGSDSPKASSVQIDGLSDITSVTRQIKKPERSDIIVEKVTDVVKFNSDGGSKMICKNRSKDKPKEGKSASIESITKFLEDMRNPEKMAKRFSRFAHCPSNQLYKKRMRARSEPPGFFSVIVENEENELPNNKRVETEFTKNHPAILKTSFSVAPTPISTPNVVQRPSSRHKRHAESVNSKTILTADRKPRKRRTLDKLAVSVEERQKRIEEIVQNRTDRHSKRRHQRRMQTEQFLKSMQMLQANCKPDHSEPFEDYSIFLYRQTAQNFDDRVKDLEKKFTYIPDRENRVPGQSKGEKIEEIQARIKGLEEKWRDPIVTDKKPKDLLRAIGKIDNSDWNIKEIEKKIIQNKLGKNVNKDKEKVPKWSREQFLARQTKMEKQHLERQDSTGGKFAEIDKNIKQLDIRLKEGSVRDMNTHKIARITEKLKPKTDTETKPIQKTHSKPAINMTTQATSEICHFCSKRVYLMERLSTEGRFFHRGCFRCQYCHTVLRLGSYLFDRDGKYGYRFYCTQHFGMPGELKTTSKPIRKSAHRVKAASRSPEKKILSGVAGVDLLDRVQTPERIEFANLSTGHASSDHEESLSQMDEDEWTDRNFGASTAEFGSSEEDTSSSSDTDSDDEDAYEEALEEPPTKEGTLRWAERYNRRYSRKNDDSDSVEYSSSDQSSYYENSSGDDESDTATEGEEEIRARELRKQEVRVEPPIAHPDTGTDTEIASDDTSSDSSSEILNSATEISTDSEFAVDDPTPTREIPSIVFNDIFVTKTRGKYVAPKKVQVKTTELQKPIINIQKQKDIDLKFTPLVLNPTPITRKPAPVSLLRTEGYALNRTQSTGGIASKLSLDLKKKYLLGESSLANSIQKSGSASTLDSKFKSFHSNISEQQKLLKSSVEANKTSNKLYEHTSPLISPNYVTQRPLFNKETPNNKEEIKKSEIIDLTQSPIADNIKKIEADQPVAFENELEGRPRSPVHETSIIVPQILWSKKVLSKDSNSDNSTSESCDSEVLNDNELHKSSSIKAFTILPRVELPVKKAGIERDSLNYDINYTAIESKLDSQPTSINEAPKSISSEKKSLNQPKELPGLKNDTLLAQVHSVLHKSFDNSVVKDIPTEIKHNSSGCSTPSNNDDRLTAVLTETELSDWARDDFEDVEYELNPDIQTPRKNKKPKTIRKSKTAEEIKNVVISEYSDLDHICGKQKDIKDIVNNSIITECVNSILNPNLDNIEFMDTGTESSDDCFVEVKNNGYIQFHNEDDMAEDSLSPVINVIEVTNPKVMATFEEDFDDLSTVTRNTGYCIIGNEKNKFGGEVIDLKPKDLEKLKEKQNFTENEEDSLLIIEPGTTTEENTCSDSTVKNMTQMNPKSVQKVIENNNMLDKKRLEDKLAQVKVDMKKLNEQRLSEKEKKKEHIEEQNIRNQENYNIEFDQHCQRLQSKVDFGNAKDSIDIRKSRRRSKSGSPPKPDLIAEEKESSPVHIVPPKEIKLVATKIYTRELIEKERDINQKLIQEMVMNKMKAQNKSLERKKRNRNSFSPSISPNRPFDLHKSPTSDISTQIKKDTNKYTPDVLLSTINANQLNPIQKSQTVSALSEFNKTIEQKVIQRHKYTPFTPKYTRPLSVHTSFLIKPNLEKQVPDTSLIYPEAYSLPDIHKAINDFKTPKAPPRVKNEEAKRTAEKLKHDARARARLLSDEDLGLSPEDKIAKLRQKVSKRDKENDVVGAHIQESIESLVVNTDRRNSILYTNGSSSMKKSNSFKRSKSGDDHLNISNSRISIKKDDRERTKSVSEINKEYMSVKSFNNNGQNGDKEKCFKSDPNLLNTDNNKKEKKKSKDRERRKSITKFIADIFGKKKDENVKTNSAKGFLSRISPKAKSKDIIVEETVRRMSFSGTRLLMGDDVAPPPVPPLPLNYTGVKPGNEDSSEGESEWKRVDRSSCDTLDQSGVQDGSSICSMSGRRSGRSARKAARQSQLKRHRLAQEIQRKLEETEVKTRELEQRGVLVEKALRGEDSGSNVTQTEEPELLKEWFNLMRDMTELRRYEKELMVRAQELELEDRHARLQHELKDRLENDAPKTKEDVEKEGSIIKEMMEIVAKRDSLITLLEEERIRYSEQDKGVEEEMLSKRTQLASILKTTAN